MSWFRRTLGAAKVEALVAQARDQAEQDDFEGAWRTVEPLVSAQAGNLDVALALSDLLAGGSVDAERGLALAVELVAAHPAEPGLLGVLGAATEALSDRRYLNAAPPEHPVFADLLGRLLALESRCAGTDDELDVLVGLSTVANVLGRAHDDVAERALRRRVACGPGRWQDHYDLGLFYKTRGRFTDGIAANQRASEVGGGDDPGVVWNLGICATAAGEGAVAQRTWRRLGLDLDLDEDGLPRGKFATVKVRLAQRPVAERDAARDAEGPGREESVWVQRLSPCHGIVRVALHHDEIGVDYGDVVVFDGAPITHHQGDDGEVPVFPHLATLARRAYQIYRFTGTQQARGELLALSGELPEDAVVYVHTEQLRTLCAQCWEEGHAIAGHDHAHLDDTWRIVTGKLCAPPGLAPRRL
ncbi:MAG: hypothetical protein KC464_08545, partial [Myxococcales bacterium]|nr:hypothetical protein [Myxococcales bacterium]